MSTNKQIITAMTVLQKYYDEDGYNADSQHDVFSLSPTDKAISAADVQIMIDCGFSQEFKEDALGNGFKINDYNPENCWYTLT